ncbi:hypothetical protein GCM10022631_27340 [Deinococcus rubellus]|uniref:Uncharacterized protein n=1 Tax=Deinococcus rubellus TaxID=1889240 RepID=A0ABY5YKW0_9DEIO|nr:hypothetical protein [Deinococcus rubellus]UWX64418.1 hypothetical protein N0D28_01740 [Deinococcus rubellus]
MPHTILGSYGGEWFTATTPQQARLLSDRAALRHLEPFLGRTLGAAQAAREAGVSTERMLYRVRQFVAVGLLSAAGEQKRDGRAIRLYTAPGGFRVPFHLTPFEDVEAELAAQMRPHDRLRIRALARTLTRRQLVGRVIYRDERGEVNYESDVPSAQERPALTRRGGDFVGVQWLTSAQAEAVKTKFDEARALLLTSSRTPGSQPYLIQTVLVQLDENDAPD